MKFPSNVSFRSDRDHYSAKERREGTKYKISMKLEEWYMGFTIVLYLSGTFFHSWNYILGWHIIRGLSLSEGQWTLPYEEVKEGFGHGQLDSEICFDISRGLGLALKTLYIVFYSTKIFTCWNLCRSFSMITLSVFNWLLGHFSCTWTERLGLVWRANKHCLGLYELSAPFLAALAGILSYGSWIQVSIRVFY